MKTSESIVDRVLSAIRSQRAAIGTTIVAIDGPGGAGKSFLAASLAKKDVSISVVPIDDFYVPLDERVHGADARLTPGINVDIARLVQDVIYPLTRGKEGDYRRYDWSIDTLSRWRTIPTGGIVIVEGVYALLPVLEGFYQFKVWMDCPWDLRLSRGVARDGEEALSQWKDHWMLAEDHYALTDRPMDRADIVLDWEYTESVDQILMLTQK